MLWSPKSIPAARMCPKDPAANTSTNVIPAARSKWRPRREKKIQVSACLASARKKEHEKSIHPSLSLSLFLSLSALFALPLSHTHAHTHPPTLLLTHWVSGEHVRSRVLQTETLLELRVLGGAWSPAVPHGEQHDGRSRAHGLGSAEGRGEEKATTTKSQRHRARSECIPRRFDHESSRHLRCWSGIR